MKIFTKVHCKAYLKKKSDGVRLQCRYKNHSDDLRTAYWDDLTGVEVKAVQDYYDSEGWHTKELADLSDFEGNSVEKVYRHRTEEEFNGVLVGFTNIIVSGRIGTDTSYSRPDCSEYYHLFKNPTYEKVGVVYFKNNSKRYVKIEDMEEVDG